LVGGGVGGGHVRPLMHTMAPLPDPLVFPVDVVCAAPEASLAHVRSK
jgi:hypothetical protein